MKSFVIFVVLISLIAFGSSDYVCKVTDIVGCYTDGGDQHRALPFTAQHDSGPMSMEICASKCAVFNFTMNAVEYAYQCFCGDAFDPDNVPVKVDMTQCQSQRCSSDSTEWCGGSNRMIVYHATCTGTVTPHGHACLDAASQKLPFCDPTLPLEKRLADLISRLTLDEKTRLLGPDPLHNTCTFVDYGVVRLGIPPCNKKTYYNTTTNNKLFKKKTKLKENKKKDTHLVETNTAVASDCITPETCATTFAGPAMLAASFNRTMWRDKGRVISDEMRAMNNYDWHRTVSARTSTSVWRVTART